MVIDKSDLLKKKERRPDLFYYKRCCICNQSLDMNDFITDNVEYVKNKIHEVYFHSNCFRRSK